MNGFAVGGRALQVIRTRFYLFCVLFQNKQNCVYQVSLKQGDSAQMQQGGKKEEEEKKKEIYLTYILFFF